MNMGNNFSPLEHIVEATTWNSGGGQMLDLLTMKDGRVLVISEESVVLYKNMDDLEAGEASERPIIYL